MNNCDQTDELVFVYKLVYHMTCVISVAGHALLEAVTLFVITLDQSPTFHRVSLQSQG